MCAGSWHCRDLLLPNGGFEQQTPPGQLDAVPRPHWPWGSEEGSRDGAGSQQLTCDCQGILLQQSHGWGVPKRRGKKKYRQLKNTFLWQLWWGRYLSCFDDGMTPITFNQCVSCCCPLPWNIDRAKYMGAKKYNDCFFLLTTKQYVWPGGLFSYRGLHSTKMWTKNNQ